MLYLSILNYNKAVESGAVPIIGPEEKPWGQFVGYVRAVDGSIIELFSLF